MPVNTLIEFTHRKDPTNVGDCVACPIDYYDFSIYKTNLYDIKKIRIDRISNHNPIIIGGGGLLGEKRFDARIRLILDLPKKTKILWGSGDNVQSSADNPNFKEYLNKFDLLGIRDYIPAYKNNWVPCVSCKHPVFDTAIYNEITNDIVIFEHKDRPMKLKLDAPVMKNTGNDIVKIVNFISSGEVVITNSYHGAYWAQLLGKKVLVNSWSSKFQNMKHHITFFDKNLNESLKSVKKNDVVLEECRQSNDKFMDRVKEIL